MSQRPGILVNHFVKADEGGWPKTKSPNAQPDVITAEVRCHWPYLAPKSEVLDALAEVYTKAVAEVHERYGK
jgi:hypothetical protein